MLAVKGGWLALTLFPPAVLHPKLPPASSDSYHAYHTSPPAGRTRNSKRFPHPHASSRPLLTHHNSTDEEIKLEKKKKKKKKSTRMESPTVGWFSNSMGRINKSLHLNSQKKKNIYTSYHRHRHHHHIKQNHNSSKGKQNIKH
jgi:hypothetical protein